MARKTDTSQIEETVLCACGLSSKVKVRTDEGWQNLCMGCYYKHHYRQSLEYCIGKGLETTEERIAWLKKNARGITKRYKASLPREPGCDDDQREDAA